MVKKSKTEEGWEKLFEGLNIEQEIADKGVFNLTADQIKNVASREPRLMTKFDNKRQLPNILRKKKLSILPNTRGTYLVGKFDAYKDYEYEDIKPVVKRLPDYITSVNVNQITSEPVALNMAKAAGMIDEVLGFRTGGGESYLTLSGRMGSGSFSYDVGVNGTETDTTVEVTNSQIEVDATYENINNVGIFEAKTLMPDNFMVRQLYYPYRTYQGLGITKPIIPIFFTYVDEIFSFNIYEFKNDNVYSSINKVEQYNFVLDYDRDIELTEIKSILEQSKLIEENEKFPQADTFSRVLDVLQKINETPRDVEQLSEIYGFDVRQGHYYGDALIYLGYAEKIKNSKTSKFEYTVNKKGKDILELHNTSDRNIKIIKDLLIHEPFNYALRVYIEHDFSFSENDRRHIIQNILDNGFKVEAESTAKRRFGSVSHWIKWIISVTKID